jgi:prolyl oligopeptidase
MKNCFFLFLLVSAANFGQSFPITKAIPTTITKFNISFQDDYVWLEDMKSETTKNWVNAQNEVCNFHLDEIKKNNNILSKIKEYNAYSSNGLPAKKEAFFYSLYTKEKGKPSVLYYRKGINDDAIALFNPFAIYKNSFAGITDYSPSKNSKFMACKISTDGSDRNEIRFVDIEKLKNLDDVLTNVKFSKIVWNQDTGIFYKRNSNQNNFAKDSTFQLFYHKLGTQQENDKLVFDTSKTGNNFSYFTKKNRLFIIEQNRISDIKNYYFIGLNNNDFVIAPFFE